VRGSKNLRVRAHTGTTCLFTRAASIGPIPLITTAVAALKIGSALIDGEAVGATRPGVAIFEKLAMPSV
jgi:hypothetical protein